MKRRWLKFALPFAPVLALATMTGIAHAVQQPDPTDASFLSPTSGAGDGARLLADGLTGNGVEVDGADHQRRRAQLGRFGRRPPRSS